MMFLKQSTVATVKIGPFLDSTDGVTAETALTITQAEVLLSKADGAFTQKNDATSCTHDAHGFYGCPLNATDTGTLGRMQLSVQESGACPVWHEFQVLPSNVYDSLFSTDKLQVDAVEISSDSLAADNLELLIENSKGTDNKVLLSTDAQDLSGSLDVNTKTITAAAITAAAIATDAVDANALAADAIAEINATVDAALSDINLDHLCKNATVGADMTAEVADNTILSRILANGDTSLFVPSTDGLQPIRDVAPHGTAMRGTDGANTTVPDAAGTAATLHGATDDKIDVVDANVDAILLDTGTDGVVVATASKTGYKLASDGIDQVVIETGLNMRQAIAVATAACCGKLSGAATATVTIKAAEEGSTTRIVGTVDADGNRSAVVLTLPA